MLLSRSQLCVAFLLYLARICCASEAAAEVVPFPLGSPTPDDETTIAVAKAVVQAENKHEGSAKNAKEIEVNKEANAVAAATTEVLDTETSAGDTVSDRVMEKASDDAKKTFKDLSASGVDSKVAADAAAKVAVATVDGASDLTLPHEAKENAEKAAVAAGEAVADHPDSQAEALQEALSTVKEEEKALGKVDLKEKPKGLVQKAEAVAAKPFKLAKNAAADVADPFEHLSATGMFMMMFFFMGMVAIGAKYYHDNFASTPYTAKLQLIRDEFNRHGVPQEHDIESQYSSFDEYNGFREMRQ